MQKDITWHEHKHTFVKNIINPYCFTHYFIIWYIIREIHEQKKKKKKEKRTKLLAIIGKWYKNITKNSKFNLTLFLFIQVELIVFDLLIF